MSLSMMQLLSVLFKCKLHFLLFRLILVFSNRRLNGSFWTPIYEHTLIYFIFLILKIYQNHIIMGIIFFSLIAKITPKVFNQAAFLYSICFDNFTCTLKLFSGSNSHFIFNSGNCHKRCFKIATGK